MPGHLHLARDAADAPAAQPIRVILAEAHTTMRRTLRRLLDGDCGIQVVGETGELAVAISTVLALRPDVLLLDLRMPGGSAMASIHELREQAPETAIVVLTMHQSMLMAKRVMDAGATGFVLKDTADAELTEAVTRAAGGRRYASPRVRPADADTDA